MSITMEYLANLQEFSGRLLAAVKREPGIGERPTANTSVGTIKSPMMCTFATLQTMFI